MNTVIEQLNEAASRVENAIPNINSGGCGVYAAIVGRRLKKEYGISPRVKIASWSEAPSIEAVVRRFYASKLRTLQDVNRRLGFTVEHALLVFKLDSRLWIHDATGTEEYEPEHYTRWNPSGFDVEFVPGTAPLRWISAIARYRYGWNTSFDRREIPFIRQTVDECIVNHNHEAISHAA